MAESLLQCPDEYEPEHTRPCVLSLACWWKEVRQLEEQFAYAQSSEFARHQWDELLTSEVSVPQLALYTELRECVPILVRLGMASSAGTTPLDLFVRISIDERLALPNYAILAAFRLRQRLNREARLSAGTYCGSAVVGRSR